MSGREANGWGECVNCKTFVFMIDEKIMVKRGKLLTTQYLCQLCGLRTWVVVGSVKLNV